jgi:hypothetical protein
MIASRQGLPAAGVHSRAERQGAAELSTADTAKENAAGIYGQ